MRSLFYPLCLAAFLSCSAAAAAESPDAACKKLVFRGANTADKPENILLGKALAAADLAKKLKLELTDKAGLSANPDVTDYILRIYIMAHENFLGAPQRNYSNYNIVRVYSTPDVFRQHQHDIILSNPASPGARLGNEGSRLTAVKSIKFLDKRLLPGGEEVRRYLARVIVIEKGRDPAAPFVQLNKLAIVEMKFAYLELSPTDQCMNPLQARVLTYRIDDDNIRR